MAMEAILNCISRGNSESVFLESARIHGATDKQICDSCVLALRYAIQDTRTAAINELVRIGDKDAIKALKELCSKIPQEVEHLEEEFSEQFVGYDVSYVGSGGGQIPIYEYRPTGHKYKVMRTNPEWMEVNMALNHIARRLREAKL